MKYTLSNEAEKDSEEIWEYTFKTWSVEQADKYISIIFSQISYITENPETGDDFNKIGKNGHFRIQTPDLSRK